MSDAAPRGQRWQRTCAPVGLFLLAFAVRCLPWPFVFGPERTIFFGSDAYYHMRRVLFSIDHFPQVLEFDRYLNFPDGARPIWTPLFDLTLAALLWPVHAVGGPNAVEDVAMFVPPLLGAATVVALYAVALRIFDRATAFLSALVLCVLSGHFWYSQLGFVDHHAAASLAATALLGAAMACVRSDGRAPERRAEIGLAVALALSLLLWPGMLLYVALVELGLLAHWATRRDREAALLLAANRFWTHVLACALVAPLAWLQSWPQWGAYSPTVLSRFQPWLLAALALHALFCLVAWRRPTSGASARARAAWIVGSGLFVLAASALALPELRDAIGEAWRWLARRETFQRVVAESEPLLFLRGAFTLEVAELRLSRFVYLFPIGLLALCIAARNSPRRAERWLFAFWGVGLAVATLAQKRFFNTGSIALALVMGWSTVAAWRVARARVRALSAGSAAWAGGAMRIATAAAFTAGFVFLLAPTLGSYAQFIDRGQERWRGDPIRLGTRRLVRASLVRTAEWIRANTPETAGFDDPDVVPEYGVLSHWDLGHMLLYIARRPMVVGNFGDDLGERNFRLHREYFLSAEPRAVRLLDQLGARYVVVEMIPPENRDRLGPRTMLSLLTAASTDELEQHRMIYESPPPPPTARFTPGYRVFQRVPPGEIP